MAIPTKKVSKVEFVEMVDEADQALAAQTQRVLDEIKTAIADGKPPVGRPMAGNNQKSKYYSGSSSYKCYYR